MSYFVFKMLTMLSKTSLSWFILSATRVISTRAAVPTLPHHLYTTTSSSSETT